MTAQSPTRKSCMDSRDDSKSRISKDACAESASPSGTVTKDLIKLLRHQLQSHGRIADLPNTSNTSSIEDDQLHDEEENAPKPKKRGRKRKEDPEVLLEEGDVDLDTRRRLQNRAAQRQFRQRKEARVTELEARMKEQDSQISALKALCESLYAEAHGRSHPANSLLTTAKEESPSPVQMNSGISPTEGAHAAASILASGSRMATASRLYEGGFEKQELPSQSNHRPASSFASIPLPAAAEPVQSLATFQNSTFQPSAMDIDTGKMDLSFDFEAPFDFNPEIALPPLFQSFLDDYTASLENSPAPAPKGLAPNQGVVTPAPSGSIDSSGLPSPATAPDVNLEDQEDGFGDDFCPGDDPTPLERSQMPCPECDFSVMSCSLPLPWRPASISGSSKDVWVSGKAWAKLCSHPLFSQCDVDELCTELRDRVRCSDDGRLVIPKSDVCDVFRTIPARARLRREVAEMRGAA